VRADRFFPLCLLVSNESSTPTSDSSRNTGKRMKSAHFSWNLSATSTPPPTLFTIIESPAGQNAHPSPSSIEQQQYQQHEYGQCDQQQPQHGHEQQQGTYYDGSGLRKIQRYQESALSFSSLSQHNALCANPTRLSPDMQSQRLHPSNNADVMVEDNCDWTPEIQSTWRTRVDPELLPDWRKVTTAGHGGLDSILHSRRKLFAGSSSSDETCTDLASMILNTDPDSSTCTDSEDT